jgi:hypothetical protein
MDNLLIKYIQEEVTPEENSQVQQWLAANDANRAQFEKLQGVWQLAGNASLTLSTDTPQALQRLKQTIRARETAPVKRIWPRVWAAAAMAGMVGVALGAYVLLKPKAKDNYQPPVIKPDTALQQPVQTDTLPSVPAVQPVPALHTDTIPVVKPHKKKTPKQVKEVKPEHRKKKAVEPIQRIDATPRKKKQPAPVQRVQPVKKHKTVKEPAKVPPVV